MFIKEGGEEKMHRVKKMLDYLKNILYLCLVLHSCAAMAELVDA